MHVSGAVQKSSLLSCHRLLQKAHIVNQPVESSKTVWGGKHSLRTLSARGLTAYRPESLAKLRAETTVWCSPAHQTTPLEPRAGRCLRLSMLSFSEGLYVANG
jgi:hypothetical protein